MTIAVERMSPVEYILTTDGRFDRTQLDPERGKEYLAIDLAFSVFRADPYFEEEFDKSNTSYTEVLTGVYDLGTLVAAISANCGGSEAEVREHFRIVGQKLLKMTDNGLDDGKQIDPVVKQKLSSLVLENPETFGIEISQ